MSDTPGVNPFDEALDVPSPGIDQDNYKASKRNKWEHKVVGLVLAHFGLRGLARTIAEECRHETGVRRLSFVHFKRLYPSFPFWLASRKVPFVHQTSVADFVHRWTRTKLFKAYEAAEDEAPEVHRGGRLGLVFEWLHVWPVCILHNDYRASEFSETVIFRPLRHTDPPQCLAVQSFASFLETLRWSP